MQTHTNERRTLLDWSDDYYIKAVKIIRCEKDARLGNHYHKRKTERFMLVQGSGTCFLDDKVAESFFDLELFVPFTVHPYVRHKFNLVKGSILLCLTDKEYDPTDDYKD